MIWEIGLYNHLCCYLNFFFCLLMYVCSAIVWPLKWAVCHTVSLFSVWKGCSGLCSSDIKREVWMSCSWITHPQVLAVARLLADLFMVHCMACATWLFPVCFSYFKMLCALCSSLKSYFNFTMYVTIWVKILVLYVCLFWFVLQNQHANSIRVWVAMAPKRNSGLQYMTLKTFEDTQICGGLIVKLK